MSPVSYFMRINIEAEILNSGIWELKNGSGLRS